MSNSATATGGVADDDYGEMEEDGGHDTITSLAGAKMLQKYNR
jgi:hypothetical protein